MKPSPAIETPTVEQQAAPPVAFPAVLTVDELAALLRVNRKTAYAAIKAGEIPGVRHIGGVIRAHRDTVLAWLQEGQARVPRPRRKP
ncbi:MAG: helix-turn-helix domain-containing protein [Myxococcales bacterium]|nr:helix-turn-helix domain-containing protein [Myxococcales bacterium]